MKERKEEEDEEDKERMFLKDSLIVTHSASQSFHGIIWPIAI